MKIGILTFHRASNYGAVLQAYALNRVIHSLGADSKIIDYRCREVEEAHSPKYIFKRQGLIKGIIHLPAKILKHRCFKRFRKRIDLTTSFTRADISKANNMFDRIIVGSDQVWSYTFSGFDCTFLLDFARNDQKYSYACSFGFNELPEKYKDKYIELLNDFNTVSVRERSAKKLLEDYDILSRIDLDPTLLLDEKEWRKIAINPSNKDKYILVYTVQPPVKLLVIARSLAKITGYEIIYLNNGRRNNKDLDHVRYSNPEEFLGYFANAEIVLTNSFHGTVFPIVFRRNLLVELKTQKHYNNRSKDLLYECGLENCIIDDFFDINSYPKAIDWHLVHKKLDLLRERSVGYLKEIIDNS